MASATIAASRAIVLLAAMVPARAVAQTAAPTERSGPLPGPTAAPKQRNVTPAGLWERPDLLGDFGGARSALAARGLSFGLIETSEVLGNPTGGIRQGAVYEGLTEASLGLDLDRLIGLPGGVINASAFQIHGRGLSTNNIGNLNNVSSIEATRATKLFELWYDQSFGGTVDLKLGQLAADQEFLISEYSGALMNSTSFGWPELPSADVPSGGPIYPLATPGIRARWLINPAWTVLAGVYNGNPAGPGTGDPQRRDASGTLFRVGDGVFAIAEAQFTVAGGTTKAGIWYGSRGTASPYVMVDQLVYRVPGTLDQGVGVFARVMAVPGAAPSKPNPVSAFLDAGVTFKGLLPGRGSDTAALGVSATRVSPTVGHRDEGIVELTYQYQAAPWWLIQPDLQYVINPGGGVPDPQRPARRIADAPVIGLRTVLTF
ncbi:carbohydrate porin [Lichenicoccus sp.]|uniref:carbohydrate porin n=1 Tax=Lichenicoccus sp. TaxID=2781899 RepID=UPI003D0F21C2